MVDKQHVKGAIDKVKGAVKDALGEATGNRRLQASGKVDKVKGALRSTVGDVKDTFRKGRRV